MAEPQHYSVQSSPSSECLAPLLWRSPPTAGEDLGLRGSQYLQAVRAAAVRSSWIELPGTPSERMQSCVWIGASIHRLNQYLWELLQSCLTCFDSNRPINVQILAAPIAAYAAVDGFCNCATQPITIVVDPSRTLPQDWLQLVVHEAAHALTPKAGHGSDFWVTLTQLCIALDLPLPPNSALESSRLRSWPPYRPHPQGSQFWLGMTDSIAWGQGNAIP